VHALTGAPWAHVLAVYKRLVAGEADQREAIDLIEVFADLLPA